MPEDNIAIPGKPAPEPPSLAEPTHARAPLPPKPDQRAPAVISPTGSDPQTDGFAQSGAYLTTAQGVPLPQTDHSLRLGSRGPTLLRDHHLREKVMHFDHERIPERVVHARGAGAHGRFESYGNAANLTRAAFLAPEVTTPVFVRFSTVLGSRGSADTVRDTRGFAVKFYTSEGNFDLVGNNIPVFFIQDGIKFPDIVHAAKPHPDREIPQAQSAHDTFWDFVSLHTEATHHVLWNMSDRGIPRSYRMMEGFGVHTFRLINAEGGTSLVKFHWKPKLGVHSLVWEEAQLIAGLDPDFHRRDLYDAIEAGAFPQWELGVQVMPDNPEQTFAGIDLLDPTKIVPEELCPVQPIGLLTLDGNPTNFFAEVEQIAFHTGHLVPGIDATDDPLLSARNFSYLDTQLTRLGGPNFAQIPINRPRVPVNDMHRDGFHQDAVHTGVAPYRPNSLDGGCPFAPGADLGAYLEAPLRVAEATVGREKPESFDDHFSQPRMFWLSLSAVEREHLIAAITFELGKCYENTIRERMLSVLARVDDELCAGVAEGLGLAAPKASEPLAQVEPSPALSQVGRAWPVDGRIIGIVVDADLDAESLAQVRTAREAIDAAGLVPIIVAPRGGPIDRDQTLPAQRSLVTARSVEFDALLLAGAPARSPLTRVNLDAKAGANTEDGAVDPRVQLLVDESFRHGKAIAAWGAAAETLPALGAPLEAAGVVTAPDATAAVSGLLTAMGEHRAWSRF
jgi:catalase